MKELSNAAAWSLTLLFIGTAILLTIISFYFYDGSAALFLTICCAYLMHGFILTLVMLILSCRGLMAAKVRTEALQCAPLPLHTSISLAIPVYNEASVIVNCIESLKQQSLMAGEIIIINDGSTDETVALLKEVYQLVTIDPPVEPCGKTVIRQYYQSQLIPALKLIDQTRGGKATALNSALQVATGEIFITVDADSMLDSQALERLVSAMAADPLVIAAGGLVKPANGITAAGLNKQSGELPRGYLPIMQWLEYATGFIWRFGHASINTLLLLSGSFSAFRTDLLREVNGFDPQSITEDYEIAYRLHTLMRGRNQAYRMVTVPDALIYTLVPESFLSLCQQRIRWFQGFIQTIFRYRAQIFNSSYGTFGIFMLPIKAFDAVAPLTSLTTFCLALLQTFNGKLPISPIWVLALLMLRVLSDSIIHLILIMLHQRYLLPKMRTRQIISLLWITPIWVLFNQFFWLFYSSIACYRALFNVHRWDKAFRTPINSASYSKN